VKPWHFALIVVLVIALIRMERFSALAILAFIGAYVFARAFMAEWRRVNSPTGSLPKSSKVLFWRRPRPDPE
jgi:hypothetical protein